MNEASKHTEFTASDIERYHNGTMSAKERHALEKAALDDPFLADALEGFAYSTTPQQDLAKIKRRLAEKTSRKHLSPVLTSRFGWLKAAAIVLLVAGGGWLVYRTMQTPVSVIATTPPATELPKNPPNKADTTQVTNFNNISSLPTQTTASAPTTEQVVKEHRLHYSIAKKRKSVANLAANSIATGNKDRNFQPLVPTEVSPQKAEMAAAVAPPEAKQAMSKQRLVAKAPDTTALAQRSQFSGDTLNLNIVLKEDKASLSEVVVINKGLKRKAEVKPNVTIEESEPADGWSSFTDYIAEQLNEHDLKQKYSGDVELSFDVNKKGEPENIVVTKSLCNQCAEEAIRLLKEGPKWKKKTRKGRVTIHF